VTIIDIHTHYGKWPFPMQQLEPTEMVAVMKRRGIGKAIVSSSLAIVYDFREGNRTLAEAIRPHPELFGYVTINLNYPEAGIQELDTYLHNPKFLGVKIHQNYSRQKIDSPDGRRVLRALNEYRRPLLLHTYSSPLESPWNAVPVAKINPRVSIILAHMGGDAWREGILAAKESPNLFVDMCASWADADKVAAAVRELGPERVLFGSDFTLFDPAQTLGMIEEADLSQEVRSLILHGNAERLFGSTLGA
jgi:predicted TIM-barrel fold metal-dependent hydrolase